MSRPFARLCWLRALIAVAVLLVACAPPGVAQQSAEPPRLESAKLDATRLDTAKLALDWIDAAFRREGLSVQALFDLGRSINPVREELRAGIDDLEPRRVQLEAQLKQLGSAPAQGAPPESEAIAAERARLNNEVSALDATLKQARLLAARADELAAQVAERRRSLYARQLFQQSPSVLSPLLWLDAAKALAGELGGLGEILKAAANSLRDRDGLIRGVMAALTLVALGIAMVMLWRWWQRRIVAPVSAATQFAKALASIGVFLRIAVTAPLAVLAGIEVLEAYQLLPDRWGEIAYGLGIAVVIASFGRAVAIGVLAPDAPWRRLIAVDDAAANTFASHLSWGARALGLLLFVLVVHKVLDAPPMLTAATNMLFALAVGGLLLHLLLSLLRTDAHAAEEAEPRALWLRAIAWLVLAAIVIALVTGYAGFAAFLAERFLSTIAVLGVLYLLVILTHAALVERLTADTPKSRAIAANFGVNPRRLGLIASLLSGGVCLLLIVGALVLVIGPLEVTPADFADTLRKLAVGFRIGDLNISFGAVLAAAVILVVALVVTRVLQGWLEHQILPRTELEGSLQQSIAAIFGYVGVIAAIVLALSQLGIDLQKVALIAGALSVGIGFGLQSIVSNFISGLILLAERPIRVGDLIVVKGEEGYVRRIRVRATEIETFERASVIIPNAEFITGAVKNWTHANTTGRIIVKVGVAYDSDADQVRDILLACASEHPRVLELPASRALLLGFGESALEFELRVFVDNVDAGLVTRSDLHLAILRRFRAAGIVMPYPQREVRIHRDGDHSARDEKGSS
jgi:potassium efflux system protein